MRIAIIVMLFLQPMFTLAQQDTVKVNKERFKKIVERISTIEHSEIILDNYSYIIDDIIKTQCTKIKEGLLIHYVNKWKELLYDYEELCKMDLLYENDVNAQNANYLVCQLKKEIELTKDIISIGRGTSLNYKDPTQSKDYLDKIKLASQRMNNINSLITKLKSI